MALVVAACAEARAAGPELRLRFGAGGRNDVFDSSRAEVRDVGPVVAVQLGARLNDRFVIGAGAHGSLGLSDSLAQTGGRPGIYSFGGGVFGGARHRWITSLLGELLPGLEVGFGVRRVAMGIEWGSPGYSREAVWLLTTSLTVHVEHPFPSHRGGYGVWFAAHQDVTHATSTYSTWSSGDSVYVAERYFVGGYGFTAGFEVAWGARLAGRN